MQSQVVLYLDIERENGYCEVRVAQVFVNSMSEICVVTQTHQRKAKQDCGQEAERAVNSMPFPNLVVIPVASSKVTILVRRSFPVDVLYYVD